jgi:chitodextrinase
VWGVGNDWDQAAARTVGGGQTLFDQYLASVGDTYWVQSQTGPGNAAGAPVTLNDTAPTNDHWDLSAIEIIPGSPDTAPPTAPSNLTATAVSSNEVDLGWTGSTDNVGVAGYDILRNGTQIATAPGTTFKDLSVSPSTPYTYTVKAYDSSGNTSDPSGPASVTTPAASVNPPVISGVTTSNITPNAAMISWTTDIPSSSQVLYGTTSSYTQSTTLDPTQTTSHSQTITGLTPNTTYHFGVQSTGSSNNTSTSQDNQFTTQTSNVTLPDMQIKVPTNAISIGTNASTGHRQLQFTHITWDAGTGPFELDPTYDSKSGTATFTQAIYKSTSPGVWTLDHSVPLPVTGVFNGGDEYTFPLTKFTLNTMNADGSLGTVVATSPKTDYCITGDTFVGGVPNTPDQTSPPADSCQTPTKPLGWSVGWGDEYDQTDPGQPIDLTGVSDGTYILHALVDPTYVLTESNPNNNVTDTVLTISGSIVSVISQTNPGSSSPTVSMASPADGSNVSGTVQLQANASAVPPASVTSVEFLLDGQPLGNPVTTSPYNFNWTIGSTPAGSHTLSARVTDSNGNVATATAITVNVVASNPCTGGNDTTAPIVTITNPAPNQTVSNTTPVAANASDNCAVASVQFFLDGKALGNPVTTSPYATNWDTTTATNGTHTLSAQATDSSGNLGTSLNVSATVQNPPPTMICFVIQADVSVHNKSTVTTPSFHTAMAGETLLAFVSSDGPSGAGKQTATVSGAGLTWTLVKRSNSQSGDSEVWQATANSVLSNATVTSTPAKAGYSQDLMVVAYEGVAGVGASVAGSGASGAPSVKLTTTAATSLVFAVGNDWDNATPRTLPSGWTMLDQWTATSAGDDYWSQYTNNPTGPAGSVVTAADTAPTNDRWNMVAIELLGSGT